MWFCSRQACMIVLNHYNSIFSGHGTFSVPFCLCLRLLSKVGCVEPVATIFPLSRHYDALGSLGLLLCHLGGSMSSVPGPPAEAPVRRKGIYCAPGLHMNGSVTKTSLRCPNHASCSCLASNFKASHFPEHAFWVLFSNAANHAVPQER